MFDANLAEDFRDRQLLFATPYKIDFSDQARIVDFVIENGAVIVNECNDATSFWRGKGLRYVPAEQYRHVPEEFVGRWYYYVRLDPTLEWTWMETEITGLVRRVLQPLEPYFECFTRVTVLLQIPGAAIPAHRDMVPLNEYGGMQSPHLTLSGDKTFVYAGEPWLSRHAVPLNNVSHRGQRFLNLKIPLSSRPDSPGHPFIVHNGKKYRYDTGQRLFFLNEVDIEHGADAVDFYRGVVFVDGVFSQPGFNSLPREAVRLQDAAPLRHGLQEALATPQV